MQLLQNTDISFNFNPFCGLSDEELEQVIVPKIDLPKLAKLVSNGQPKIVEFVGKKGRGKTSHLKLLQQHLSDYPLFLLNEQSDFSKIYNHPSKIVFIDSIHHFNMWQRRRLFQMDKTIVLTTHWSRFFEIKMAGKAYFKFDFKGIDKAILTTILENRMRIASTERETIFKIKNAEVASLIKKYGDDYRGILNHLYDEFQKTKMI